MKKLFIALLCLALGLCGAALAEEEEIFTRGDYQYALTEGGAAEIIGYIGKAETLDIPGELDGHAVTAIGDSAFASCYSLTAVTIPDGVTAIGVWAFVGCSSLTAVTIPDSVTEIGANPFEACGKLTDIRVSPEHPALAVIDGALYSKADRRLVCCPMRLAGTSFDIPQGIRVIGDRAFAYCNSLTAVTIPDSVTTVGDATFFWCRSLTSVTIPDSVTAVGDWAFSDCRSLTAVTIPDSVTTIGANPFYSCGKLADIRVSPEHPALAVIDGALYSKVDRRLVCCPMGLGAETFEIPQGIRVIGNSAFSGCSSLTAVTIPDSVTAIGNWAFYSCRSLTAVTIPDSVTDIGANPFAYCDKLTDIRVSPDHPALAVIDGALYSKADRRLVCCPEGIGAETFEIPQGIRAIGDWAFSDCRSLTAVTIPDGVTAIGDGAFYSCDSLTTVNIPDSVIAIGDRAFAFCDSPTLTVPRDSYAAQYCKDNGLNYAYLDALDWLKD